MAKGAAKIAIAGSSSLLERAPSQGDRKATVVLDPMKETNQFMVELRHAAQHVFRHQHGIVGHGLRYVSNDEVQL